MTSTFQRLFVMTLLAVICTGCGGGGATTPVPPTQPPVVSAVSPTNPAGRQGSSVVFNATASESPTAWSWAFPTGVTPAASTDATPTITLLLVGQHAGSVIATNALGDSARFDFTFTIADRLGVPVVTEVQPTGTLTGVGGSVMFSATATDGPHTWQWTFNELGEPRSSTETNPTVRQLAPGMLQGSVIATNALGSSAPLNFTCTIPVIPSFADHELLPMRPDQYTPRVVIFDGRPVVLVRDDAGDFLIGTTNTATPAIASDWQFHKLEDRGDGGLDAVQPPLAVIGGRLAVPLWRHGDIAFANQMPESSADWTRVPMPDIEFNPVYTMAEINGFPALSGRDLTEGPALAIAKVAQPQSAQDWDAIHPAIPIVDGSHVLLSVGGRALLAGLHIDEAFGVAIAVAPPPGPDWENNFEVHAVAGVGHDSHIGQGVLVNGRPALMVARALLPSGTDLMLLRANVEVPHSASDWTTLINDGPALNRVHDPPGLVSSNGELIVMVRDNRFNIWAGRVSDSGDWNLLNVARGAAGSIAMDAYPDGTFAAAYLDFFAAPHFVRSLGQWPDVEAGS